PSVRRINPGVSWGTESIVHRCLSPDPKRRYQSAAELLQDLDNQLKNRPLRFAPDRSISERTRKWFRRHPRLWSVGGVTSLSAILVGTLGLAAYRYQTELQQTEAIAVFDQLETQFQSVRSEALTAAVGTSDVHDAKTSMRTWIDSARNGVPLPPGPGMKPLPALRIELLDRERQERTRGMTSEMTQLLEAVELWRNNRRQVLPGPPEEIEVSDDQTAFYKALRCMVQRRTEEAIHLLKELVSRHPESFSDNFLYGLCLLQVNHWEEAEHTFTTCTLIEPENRHAWFHRGLTRLYAERVEGAIEDFRKALSMKPRWPEASYNLALSYWKHGNPDEALEQTRLARQSGHPATRTYFLESKLLKELGRNEESAAMRKRGLQEVPTTTQDWVTRGEQQLPGDPEAALRDFQQALDQDPNCYEALRDSAGVLAEYLNRPEESCQALTQAIEWYPHIATLWSGRAVLYARDGHREQAIADAETALQRSDAPFVAYQCACVYALTSSIEPSDADRAVRLLKTAVKQDPKLTQIARSDKDLANIIERKDVKMIIVAALVLNDETRAP
ncbi:MAG: tetratricopeptide repeat protein, partial [Planctomycetaceae bacterium]|nr:tetratricopeptide repeat protein [Planctomycetaceae bacterium]